MMRRSARVNAASGGGSPAAIRASRPRRDRAIDRRPLHDLDELGCRPLIAAEYRDETALSIDDGRAKVVERLGRAGILAHDLDAEAGRELLDPRGVTGEEAPDVRIGIHLPGMRL